MTTLKALIVSAALATATPAFAHGPKIGPNGGQQADAGSLHLEVVSKGTTLEVLLNTHSDKTVPSAGHKGTAILVVGGKPQRIPLEPAGGNKLSGTAAVELRSEEHTS